MAVKKFTNAQIFNVVYDEMSATFQSRIPRMDAENQSKIGALITAEQFTVEFNQWLNALVNRIGMVIIHDAMIRNRLGYLVYGKMEFGDAIQELMTNVVKSEDYDPGQEGGSINPFRISNPEVKALYHRINSKRKYRITIYPDRAKTAFMQDGGLQTLLQEIVTKLVQSAELDDWLSMKEVFNTFINKDDPLPKKPNQIATITAVTDEASGKAFIKQVKNIITDMSFPRNNYNQMGIEKMVRSEYLIMFIRKEIANLLPVDVLSSAFNRDDLNFSGAGETPIQIEIMDDFGGIYPADASGNRLYPIYNQYGMTTGTYAATAGGTEAVAVANWVDPNKGVAGIICERKFPLITRQLERMEVIWNPEGLYTNTFFHQWSQYGYSGFMNAVILKEADAPAG